MGSMAVIDKEIKFRCIHTREETRHISKRNEFLKGRDSNNDNDNNKSRNIKEWMPLSNKRGK